MGYFSLLPNELRLHLVITKEYWFETVSTITLVSLIFTGLFYGIKSYFAGADDAPSLDGLLFGYLLWFFSISAYTSASQSMIEANQTGVINQLFLCSSGFVQLFLARVTIILLWNALLVTVLAFLAMLLTSNWININFFTLYGILFLAAPALVGMGFIVSGLALVFKRVDTIVGIMLIGCVGLIVVDAYPINYYSLLPFAMGASLARDVVLNENPVFIMDLILIAINSVIYLSISLAIFKLLESRAKRLNLIGQY